MIPTRNPSALIAYYVGVFSIIPCLGPIPAIVALILGIKGLGFANQHPEVKGKAHAWVGITMGALFTLIYGAITAFLLVALIKDASQG